MKFTLNRHTAFRLFRFGTELLGKTPRLGDGPLEVVTKLLSMADAYQKIYGGKRMSAPLYKVEEKTSEPFVRLFFNTTMSKGFKLSRYAISEHLDLIEALAPDGGRLIFQEYSYGRPELSDDFFHTPGFDFRAAMGTFWDAYPHGLFLSVKPARRGYGNEITFEAMGAPRAELLSQVGTARILDGVEEWRLRGGVPWTFIAYGPPGTGKTNYVQGVSAGAGGRLLMIDATSLQKLSVQDVTLIIDALAPHFLLIDDFEEAPVEAARARLRYLFDHLHKVGAGVTVAVTVNDATKLDEALLRSERIDEAKEFPLPDVHERRDILKRLTAIHVPGKLTAEELAEVVVATEGFNHADLAALVRRFRTKAVVATAFADMKKLRDLAAASAKKEAKSGDTPPTTKFPDHPPPN